MNFATVGYLREQGEGVTLATYDARMSGAARSMGIDLFDLAS